MIDAISPDCLMAQGIESNDVPIIVFQMANLYDEIKINFNVGSIGCYQGQSYVTFFSWMRYIAHTIVLT